MSRRGSTLKYGGVWRSKASLGPGREERDEKGFTLIELLVVVSIMPIIVGAISGGLIAVLSLQTSVSSRLADTSDAQVVSSTFIKDVQSATFMTTSATSSPQCGTGTQLLGLQWGNTPQDIASGNPANPSTLVSYDLVPVTSGSTTTYSLVREYCTLGNYTTPASTTTVSFDVASTQPPPCYSSAACDPTDLAHNPPIGWTSPSALVPQSNQLLIPVVKFVVAEVKSNFVFTLFANSLSWTPAAAQSGTVGPAFSPLTLLSQASGSVLTMSGGDILTISGTGVVGTTAAFASPFDSAAFLPTDADLSASSLFTEDPNLASLSGSGLGWNTPEYYDSSIPDPLKGIFNSSSAPSANPPWPLSGASPCTVSGSNYTCYSGLYSSGLSFPSGSTVCFCQGFGNYEFAGTFQIPWNSTITFDQGNYVFDGSPAISAPSPNQTLAWTSTVPSPASLNSTYTPAASDSAGLPVTYSIDALSGSGACTIAGAVGSQKVTFKTANTICLVDANQAGNPNYNPADQIQQVIPVTSSAKTTQTITFTSTKPSPATINGTYTPAATASSGLTPVTFSANPSAVCTLSGGVVTFKAAGTCLINASQGGGFNGGKTYLQAPVAQQAVVVIAGSGVTSITGNNVLFYVKSGSVDFGTSTSVVLTPLLDGLSIWDATSNAATSVDINNIASNRNSYGGIYIPGGNVNATSSSLSGSMSVMFIVAKTLSFPGLNPTTVNVTGP